MHRLMGLSTGPPQDLQDRFAHVAGITDDHSIGGIMAVLGIVEQGQRALALPYPNVCRRC